MLNNICEINSWEICGFEPDTYSRSALLSGSYDGMEWIGSPLPRDVHSILIENNKIPHPHYKANDLDCLWVEKKIWVYRTCFNVSEDMLKGRLFIQFEGLDTYAAVILNGREAASYENMFIEHELDITDIALPGENSLILEFDVMGRRASSKPLPEGFWINYSTERAYARKAAYQFGWDWTSRIATAGIWKPVRLISCMSGRINSVHITSSDISIPEKKAILKIDIDGISWAGLQPAYRIEVETPAGEVLSYMSEDKSITIHLEGVHFWWTHDLGTPELYRITVTMLCGGTPCDSKACNYGIRKLELKLEHKLNSEEKNDKCFMFVLNDVPLMARGANWVPVSNFLSSAEDEGYLSLISMAKQANMNMLSLWGGGIYEKDVFYEACDREGILVWQYFMFACGEYPDYDEDFVAAIKEEVGKAVKRLRNYSCIALWVGNVEGQMLCEKIKLPRKMYGERLFNELIPGWLKELDTTRSYLPSSPWSESGPANSMESGDRHNWDVWFTDVPYIHYAQDTTRFSSEFGLHSSPARQTVTRYIGEENAYPDNFYFKYMNKDQSLGRMNYYIEQHAGEYKNLDEYIDYSMYVQAEGIKFACEHFRRRFPHTAGALVWQLNDCMPVHSWSMIDYDLIPKASYYYAARFFTPAAISLEEIDDTLTGVWVLNNTQLDLNDTIKLEVRDFFGNLFYSEELKADVPANTAVKLKELRVGGRFYPNVIIPNRHRMFYTAARGNRLGRQIRFFGNLKDIPFPPARLAAERTGDSITIRTDNFARFVKIDGDIRGLKLSDNYFDLEPGQTKTITVQQDADRLYVKALNSDAVLL